MTTFLPPHAYYTSCVPRALAAVLDRPVGDVAGRLWAAGAARRGDGPGGLAYGTETRQAADVAVRSGHRVQLWNPDGTLFLDHTDLGRFLASRAHLRATTVRRTPLAEPSDPAPEDLVLRLDTDPELDPDLRLLTLREWRSRFPFGRWLVVVLVPDRPSHALAVEDGEIVAGGRGYLDHTVATVYRILPPSD